MQQAELVHTSGIAQSRLSRISRGHIPPTATELKQIAHGLHTTESALKTPRNLSRDVHNVSTPTANSSLGPIGTRDMVVDFLCGQIAKLDKLDTRPFRGRYDAYTPTGDWLTKAFRGKTNKDVQLRIVDLRIHGAGDRSFFDFGKSRYGKRKSDMYFTGEVFASTDRLFLIGYDPQRYLDWIFMILFARNGALFGLQTMSLFTSFGARRVVLMSSNRRTKQLPQEYIQWLEGADHWPGFVVDMPATRPREED